MKFKTKTIHKAGKKAIHFKEGSLHAQLKVPQGTKIPAAKMQKALSGGYGSIAKKKAEFAKNVLVGRGKH